MKTKDLIYENWLEGKFELNNVYQLKNGESDYLPPTVNPSSLSQDQLDLINQEQSRLFHSLVVKQSKILIDDFNTRYTSSEFPKTTLYIEADRIVSFIRGEREKYYSDDLVIEKIGELVKPNYNLNFDKYVNQLLRGIEPIPNFVPGPNSGYYDHKTYVLPEVYTKSLVNLYAHLSKFDSSIDPKRLFTDPYKGLFHDEPVNSFPNVFSSGYSYHLFINIEEIIIVPEERPKSGDYNLIYKVLDHPLVNGFLKGVSFLDFINFINKSKNINLTSSSNKPAHQKLKKNIIRFFLRDFFYNIKAVEPEKIDGLVYKVIEQKATY